MESRGARKPPAAPLLAALLVASAAVADAAGEDLLRQRGTVRVDCETAALDLGEAAHRWALGDGFYFDDRELTSGRTFVWTDRRAELIVVLAGPRDRRLRLTAGSGPQRQSAAVRWNGIALGSRALSRDWSVATWEVPPSVQRPGVNVLEIVADRHLLSPPDPRRLALRVDRLDLTPAAPCPEGRSVVTRGPFSGPVALAPGAVLIGRVAVAAAPRLRLDVAGAPGAAVEWSWAAAAEPPAPERIAIPAAGELAVEIAPRRCCRSDTLLAVAGAGPSAVRLRSLAIADDHRLAGWRRACRLHLPLAASGLALLGLLVVAAGGRRTLAGRPWLEAATVAAVALGLRLVYLHLFPASGLHGFPDSHGYLAGALRLLAAPASAWGDVGWHHWFTFIRPPGYFVFVAAVLGPLGGDVDTLAAVQAVLSAAAAGAVYLAAHPLFGTGAARVAGLLFALDPYAVSTASWIMTEPLYLFFVAVALAALARLSVAPSWPAALAAGVAFGLAALVRSAPLYFAPAAAVVVGLVHRRRRGWTAAAVFVAGALAVVAPWCVRNSLLYGAPMGIDDLAVMNFLQAHPDDRWVSSAGIDLATREGRLIHRHRVADANADRRLTRSAGAILRDGLLRMAARPGATLREFAANLAASHGPEAPEYLGMIVGAGRSCATVFFTDLRTAVLLFATLLGVVGVAVGWRRAASWPLLLWAVYNAVVVNLLFRPEPRFTLAYLPAVEVFAGAGLVWLHGAVRRAAGAILGR